MIDDGSAAKAVLCTSPAAPRAVGSL